MSPAHPAPLPLRRTSINLFAEDIAFVEALFGNGWQTEVRNAIHEWTKSLPRKRPTTLGDLADD